MRAVIIFVLFIFGLSAIGNFATKLEQPAASITAISSVILLLYVLNRFWNARKEQP